MKKRSCEDQSRQSRKDLVEAAVVYKERNSAGILPERLYACNVTAGSITRGFTLRRVGEQKYYSHGRLRTRNRFSDSNLRTSILTNVHRASIEIRPIIESTGSV